MPEINLLSSEAKTQKLPWEIMLTGAVRILGLIFVLTLGYYGYLFITSKTTATKIYDTQNSIIAIQKQILTDPNRQELLVRQAQLKEANQIIGRQLFWSKLLPEVGRVTLQNAAYTSLVSSDGKNIRLQVVVPNYEAMDRFLQVFDTPQFNKNLYNVRVTSIVKGQDGDQQNIRFDIDLAFDPTLLAPVEQKAPEGVR